MEYGIRFSESALNVVLEALSVQSYRVVAPIITDIQRQVQEHVGRQRPMLEVIHGGDPEAAG